MITFTNPYLMRIFLNEMDQTTDKKSLYETIIEKAKNDKLAGATAYKGCLGYGASAHIHTTKILILSEDLPIVIEIIDEKQKLDLFFSHIEPLLKHTFVTFQKIDQVLQK
jgi:uncharacterized protein